MIEEIKVNDITYKLEMINTSTLCTLCNYCDLKKLCRENPNSKESVILKSICTITPITVFKSKRL